MIDSEIVVAVEESPEGGYEARALGHAIFTQADSMDELREMVRDAVRCHFEEDSIPAMIDSRSQAGDYFSERLAYWILQQRASERGGR